MQLLTSVLKTYRQCTTSVNCGGKAVKKAALINFFNTQSKFINRFKATTTDVGPKELFHLFNCLTNRNIFLGM